MMRVDIYTDGACSGNPGPGGWGAVLSHGERRLEISGYAPATTNNRMELTAVIEALRRLKKPCAIRLHTDSTYVCKAFNEGWIGKWQAADWRRKGAEIPNADLWKDLLEATRSHEITWIWVRGHADNAENNRCDAIAREAIRKEFA